jgi:hypothetical protein
MTSSLMNNKFRRLWNNTMMASFEVLFWHLPGRAIMDNHETPVRDSQCPG